jgi:hypothetical protein
MSVEWQSPAPDNPAVAWIDEHGVEHDITDLRPLVPCSDGTCRMVGCSTCNPYPQAASSER